MRSTTFKILILFFFLSSYTFNLKAQNTNSVIQVSGSLLNELGKPVDFATVSLLQAKDSTIIKGSLSNDAGVYFFKNIRPGNYLINVTSVGYIKAGSGAFAITPETKDILLPVIKMQSTGQKLEAVNIVASKPLMEYKSDRIVMNVQNSILAAGNSALEILERAPGVSIDPDYNISLKGKQGVTVMINDKLTYLSSTQLATLLRATDGNTIQSIEIITNPSAKYDASGSSGIINIKLKKNKQSGTNGSVTTSVGYSKFWKDNTSITLNHQEGKLNVFGTLSRNDNEYLEGLGLDRIVKENAGNPTYFNQQTDITSNNHNNSFSTGADYDITGNNTIGFVLSGYSNSEKDNNTGHANIGATPGAIDSSANSTSGINQTYKNIAINLNDRYKIDTAGQTLSIDLDYSKFNNTSNALYNNYFFLPDGSELHAPQILSDQSPSIIDIHTVKADYTKPLTKTIKLEAGVKVSDVKTDNNLQAQVLSNGNFINDTTRTNHFIYDEKIEAGYVNLNQTINKTSVQIGLRTEYTQSNSNLIGSVPIDRHYLDFFPSLFVNHPLDNKNEIGFSYSRRIDRPGYSDLNPFTYYLDPFTIQQGNAFLTPQYTNSFELNYAYNKAINVSLGYSRTTNAITTIVLTEGDQTIQTYQNLQVENSYNLSINAPYTVTKWWTGNVNFNGFFTGFKSASLEGTNINDGKVAFQLKTTQSFTFAGFRSELMAYYNSDYINGILDIKPAYRVDAGISRSFADRKLNIKFSIDDIFNINEFKDSSQLLNNNFFFTYKTDSRVSRLALTYNFGNKKNNQSRHTGGAEDEKERVKGS